MAKKAKAAQPTTWIQNVPYQDFEGRLVHERRTAREPPSDTREGQRRLQGRYDHRRRWTNAGPASRGLVQDRIQVG